MSVVGSAVRTVKAGTQPSTYTGQNRIPAVLALFIALVIIAAARNRKLPDQQHMIALGVGAIIVAGAAAVFPRFVFWVLLAMLVVVAVNNSDVIANYITSGSAKLRGSLAAA